ncbi:hypothetical protein ACIQZG_22735 [Lysinibacillus sp. NPDC096418]|uniref:hypothetical protein n=1 Tax=Lysinibacillus sp. NPDC096418 TaxID=3364138 RepID=UPI0038253B96
MRKVIEPFINNKIVEEVYDGDTIYFYGADEILLAELYLEEQKINSITFYHQELNRECVTREQLLAIIKHVQQVFHKEDYVLYHILDGDDYYVELTLQEPRFQLPIHSTGMKLHITKEGQLEEIFFLQDEVEITYPEKIISKEQARQLLLGQPLMKKSIIPDNDWQYGYAPNHEIAGVEVNGRVRFMRDLPEMKDACFKELPAVEPVADIQSFLLGGRACGLNRYESDDRTTWEIDDEHFDQKIEGNPFDRACIALKTIVDDEYIHYYLESIPNLYAALGMEDLDEEITSYRFVYVVEDSSFDFLAISISVHQATNQICSVMLPHIPYEQLKRAPQPKISLEEANKLAKELVDVELTLEREGFGSNRYQLIYLIDYPTSPTQGHIHYIDGETGEVHFVETGF